MSSALVFPVFGPGKRLFEGGSIPAALRLVDSATTPHRRRLGGATGARATS